jgi:Domain of Unknown Function (DUF1080)
MHKKIIFFFVAMCCLSASAQDSALKNLPLENLSSFKPQAGNWQIVGVVSMNPLLDFHSKPISKPIVEPKKKKSKGETAPSMEEPKAVTYSAGNGILLNVNDESKKDNLVSSFEHGDIDLELEVMLPKGSNSGIYLQGRYELQLFDSWGVTNPKFSDIGGIYRNWENEPSKAYAGKAPLSNPCKAPGLWQTLKISFRAPKFDSNGKKIANAQFVSVELNGIKIHDHVEVPLPTGGPIENNEKPTGPLMIQGDHGPVAFRNIRYKVTKDLNMTISNIGYQTYSGRFTEAKQFATAKAIKTGTTKELTWEVVDGDNGFGVMYNGMINVPDDGDYTFKLGFTGGIEASINGQEIATFQRPDGWWEWRTKTLTLKAGSYPFSIAYFKDASWMPPRLALIAQRSDTHPLVLNAINSYPPDANPTSPILISEGAQPKLLRAFLDFNGDRKNRLTHTIGVAYPGGINYAFDLTSGNLACVWRGDFVDATPMWHERGDGSFKPLGATQYMFLNQPLAFLSNASEPFPTASKEGELRSKGYVIEEATNRPIFKYAYQGLEVEDKIFPDGNGLTHEISIGQRGTKNNLYYKLAEGSEIVSVPNTPNYFIIDGQYYIQANGASVRAVNGKKELIMTVTGNSLKYSIIW